LTAALRQIRAIGIDNGCKSVRSRDKTIVREAEAGDAHCVNIILSFFGAADAVRTPEQVLLERSQFILISDHTEVIPFEIIVRNVWVLHKGGIAAARA